MGVEDQSGWVGPQIVLLDLGEAALWIMALAHYFAHNERLPDRGTALSQGDLRVEVDAAQSDHSCHLDHETPLEPLDPGGLVSVQVEPGRRHADFVV